MSRHSTFRVAALLAATSLSAMVLHTNALAQTTSPPAASPAPAAVPAPSAAPALPKSQLEKVEQHIKQLHDQLGITTAEEPQWAQFAQVMRDNAAQMEQAFAARSANLATATAVDNLQSYAQLTQVHATNMQKLASAFQVLYNTFPDAQKKVADTVFQNSYGKPHSSKK